MQEIRAKTTPKGAKRRVSQKDTRFLFLPFQSQTEMKMESNEKQPMKRGRRVRPPVVRRELYKQKVIELYTKGHSMARIAELCEEIFLKPFAYTTIQTYIHQELEKWQTEKARMMQDHKSHELARINTIEVEAWAGWQRSLEAVVTVTEKRLPPSKASKTQKAGQLKEVITTTKPSNGDPRFLDTVKWCVEQRCKILGFEAPQKASELPDKNLPVVPQGPAKIVRNIVYQVVTNTQTG